MAYTYAQTVYDAFPGSTLNTGLWTDESQNSASGQIAVSGGILRLQAKANYEVEVDATHYFDTTSGLWAIKWGHTGTGTADTSGDGTAGTECYFGFADAANNYFELQTYPASNTWYPWNAINNGNYTTGTGNQNAFGTGWTSGNWIGIGDYNLNGDNRLHVYSSPDGSTWTEIASWVVSGPINMSAVELFLGTYQHTSSSTWVSQFQAASTFARSGSSGGGGGSQVSPPSPPILGMYETGGNFPTPGPSAWPSGPTTNLAATYMAWGQDFPTYAGAFITECNSNGLIPFVELEPWESGTSWNVTPLFSSITGGTWDTWLTGIGTFIAGTGKPCILTFGHEMNVSGQYPWSQGDTGSGPGGGALTAAEWIAGWAYVKNKINSTAGGKALWMWACSAFTGGTNVSPAPWWPSSALPDMVGIDGYPNTQYGSSLGTFAGQIQPTVTIIRGLGWTKPIFLAETNLAQMVSSGGESIPSFVADMHTAGISGILEFEDASWGLPQMSSAQWTQYNNAVAEYYGSGAAPSSALLSVAIA